MRFFKYHALGNDYLVMNPADYPGWPAPTPEQIRVICHRNFGAGSDGILWGPLRATQAQFGLRIFNPDGSEAEKSGNGLRIFAQWLVDVRNAPRRFSVWTGVCLVHCDVGDDVIAVDMGHASFEPTDVPVIADAPLLDGALPGGPWKVCAVGLGNPHCVVFVDDPDAAPWRALAPPRPPSPSQRGCPTTWTPSTSGWVPRSVADWKTGALPCPALGRFSNRR